MKFGTDNTGPEVFSLTLLGLFYSLEFLRICSPIWILSNKSGANIHGTLSSLIKINRDGSETTNRLTLLGF